MQKEIIESLSQLFFHIKHPDEIDEYAFTISALAGIFTKDNLPDSIKKEVESLNRLIPKFRILEELLDAIKSSQRNEIRWEPHFHREEMPQQLTLSPTFNISNNIDSLTFEIKLIREEINQHPIDYSAIIGWIISRANEEGYKIEKEG